MSTTRTVAIRPATPGDRAALGRVVREYETRVFGSAPEPDEAAESVGDPARIQLAQIDGGEPVSLVRTVSDEQIDVLAGSGATMATRDLLQWANDTLPGTTIRVPDNDDQLLDALTAVEGWVEEHASYEVFRDLAAPLSEFRVDDRIRVDALPASPDLDALHQLIYHDAEWAASGAGRHEDLVAWRGPLAGHDLRGALATDLETGGMAGVIIAWQDTADLLWMHRLAVATRYRGRGVAEGLLHRMVVDGRSDGTPWLGISTYGKNAPARRLYDKWKFDVQNVYLIWRATG